MTLRAELLPLLFALALASFAEIVGLAATFAAMRLWRSDLLAMFVGVAAVALCRAFVQ